MAPIVKQVTFGDGICRFASRCKFGQSPGVFFWTEQGLIVSVGSSNFGLTANRADNTCGVFARLFYRMAYSLISFQCQDGRRVYPSRFSLKMLQYSADHGHLQAMAQLGGMLYRCGVGRADKRSGLEYLRRAAKSGDIDSQYLLGAAHMDGQLVRRDDKTAIHWLALAADRGHGEAANLLEECKIRQSENPSTEHAIA